MAYIVTILPDVEGRGELMGVVIGDTSEVVQPFPLLLELSGITLDLSDKSDLRELSENFRLLSGGFAILVPLLEAVPPTDPVVLATLLEEAPGFVVLLLGIWEVCLLGAVGVATGGGTEMRS